MGVTLVIKRDERVFEVTADGKVFVLEKHPSVRGKLDERVRLICRSPGGHRRSIVFRTENEVTAVYTLFRQYFGKEGG
jgi:hypothetical protein